MINVNYIIAVFIVSIFSIILHELMHGVTAYALGDQTARLSGRLTLNPLKHIDPVMSIIMPVCLALIGAPVFGGAKPVPINTRNLKGGEWGFALVAIAGPLTNFILAFIFFLIGHFTGLLYTDTASIGASICAAGVYLNLGLCLFNLIPIPPLDGSRVLYALAPEGVQNFMRTMEMYGIVVVYILIIAGGTLLSNYMYYGQNSIIDFFYWIVVGPR
ncbi:MAG: site-2 protease family protein [Candidatus Saccharibacteria bacterium]|nr:site-2 protease family protein [Candidatus Saccharibacteria bacterium]